MYGFCLKGEQIKLFMNEFLKGETFDGFLVKHMEVFSVTKFETDGNINPDYLKEGEKRRSCFWRELRPIAFGLIKGKVKPKIFKTVLALPLEKAEILSENAASMHLSVTFENNRIVFLTGTSQKSFSLDKDVDLAWEGYIKKIFKLHGFICETLE
ncbi:MAG: DUF5721 family protein [Clostridiales bacterium]|nr:DUF5721 family protein [Clostridiales bacterium]